MKTLFVTEKWCDGKKESGETNSKHNLIGSYKSSEISDYSVFNYDDYYINNNKEADDELLNLCNSNNIDLIVATYLFHDLPYDPNIKIKTWGKINIPVIFIWFDLVLPFVVDVANELSKHISLNVSLDTSDFSLVKEKEKFINLWTPQDCKYFYRGDEERDIDVCFLGSVKDYSDRNRALGTLYRNGLNVFQLGGQRENAIPFEAYATILQRSKISLNFPFYRGTPFIQAKGRIFESTLCGSLLIDVENPQTNNWFVPGRDYVSVKNIDELESKIHYYLNNEKERNKIAKSGCDKANLNYNCFKFWENLLKRINLT